MTYGMYITTENYDSLIKDEVIYTDISCNKVSFIKDGEVRINVLINKEKDNVDNLKNTSSIIEEKWLGNELLKLDNPTRIKKYGNYIDVLYI